MTTKRQARIAYYEGVRTSLVEMIDQTEAGLRNLENLSADQIDKLVSSVRKKHDRLIKKIDNKIDAERALAP